MKKILTMLTAVIFLLECFSVGVCASTEKYLKFVDINGNEYYADAAQILVEQGILKGYTDGSFGADLTITRAEMAAIICRRLGIEDDAENLKGSTAYTDVKSTHWASGYINIASDRGVINGYGNGKFGPDDQVTYIQAAKMLVCALGYEDEAEQKGGWPIGYMNVAIDKKITTNVNGTGRVNSIWNNSALRGDLAVMAYNSLPKKVKNGIETLKEYMTQPVGKANITGVANDSYGNGLGFAVVYLYRDGKQVAQTTTDNNGIFKFSVEDAANYTVEISKEQYNSIKYDFNVSESNVNSNSEIVIQDRLILDKESNQVTGMLFDSKTNNMLSDFMVTYKNSNGDTYMATTDIMGQYKLDCPAGNYEVTFSKDGYESIKKNVIVNDDGTTDINTYIDLIKTNSKDEPITINIPVDFLNTHEIFLINGHTYSFFSATSWSNALSKCISMGGHLATISSATENNELFNAMITQGFKNSYFGYTDEMSEGFWVWINGEQLSYTNWHSNEPNSENEHEDYAMFYYKYTDGTWNDGDAGYNGTVNDSNIYICEWDFDINSRIAPTPVPTKKPVSYEDVQLSINAYENAFNDYADAIETSMQKQKQKEENAKKEAIENWKKYKNDIDNLVNLDFIIDANAKEVCYKAIYEAMAQLVDKGIELKEIDMSANMIDIESNTIKKIINAMDNNKIIVQDGDYTITVDLSMYFGAMDGYVICENTKTNDKNGPYQIVSNANRTAQIMEDFANEMKDMGMDAISSAVDSLLTEFENATGVSSFIKKEMLNKFEEFAPILNNSELSEFVEFIENSINDLKTISQAREKPAETAYNYIKKISNMDVTAPTPTIADKTVKKAYASLQKARKDLIDMSLEYVSDNEG